MGSSLRQPTLAALLVLLAGTMFAVPASADEPLPYRNSPTRLFRKIQDGLLNYGSQSHERDNHSVKKAFQDVVRSARQSTVRIRCNDKGVALGTIVDERGYVVTKASLLTDNIECLLSDGRAFDAEIIGKDRRYDLALLQVDAKDLVPVTWSTSTPQVGALLATSGLQSTPTAIGVASTPPRTVAAPAAALGIVLETADPRVTGVMEKSAAARVGIEVGDVVVEVDGKSINSRKMLIDTIRGYSPGERVKLKYLRDGNELTKTVVLGDRSRVYGESDQAEIMDSLGGPLSQRRLGFPQALQHDTILRPRDCGGPLVDLDGHVVGVNIARASRVASYAIPAESVQAMVQNFVGRTRATSSVAGD